MFYGGAIDCRQVTVVVDDEKNDSGGGVPRGRRLNGEK